MCIEGDREVGEGDREVGEGDREVGEGDICILPLYRSMYMYVYIYNVVCLLAS